MLKNPHNKKFLYTVFYLCLVLLSASTGFRDKNNLEFSFAVVADPRGEGGTWRNTMKEIRDMKLNPEPEFGPASFIIVAGDMDPLEERYKDFKDIFVAFRPQFLPVIGNHEFEDGGRHFRYARDVVIPSIPNAARRHPLSCDYFYDYKNVRIIAVDGYTDLGRNGVINKTGREWIESAIVSSPVTVKHIFVIFHEPAFPRSRHLNDSFNESVKDRDAFWEMLIKHRNKVRAVFTGHTHSYSRMRVAVPSGEKANSLFSFPDEENGIYQIDAGASGQADINTIVRVRVNGNSVRFRIVQAEKGDDKPFQIKDEWETRF